MSGNSNGSPGNELSFAVAGADAASVESGAVLFWIASFNFSVLRAFGSLRQQLPLKSTSAPARLRPNAAASASTAEPSNLARTSGRSEDFGSQAATKSPPGPNLQSGSACFFLSGIIFLRFPAFTYSSNLFSSKCSIGSAR